MTDKKELLNELKISRESEAVSTGKRGFLFWFPWILLLAVLTGFTWNWWRGERQDLLLSVATARSSAQEFADQQQGVLDATGYITARRQATVSAEMTGKVVEVLVEEGMHVEQGQLLARLDDALLNASVELAQARLAEARSNLKEVAVTLVEADASLARIRNLEQAQLASTQALDEAIARVGTLNARLNSLQHSIQVAERNVSVQQEQLADTLIRAPFTGVVINKAAQPGEIISPVSAGGGFTRTGICTIVDMNSLEIEVDVSESYINRVQAGQAVEAVLNSYADWRIPAEVITIIPAADRNRATVSVRIRLLEKDDRILPDMGVKVSFLNTEQALIHDAEKQVKKGVFIPASAIWADQEQNYVFVLSQGQVQRRLVTVDSESVASAEKLVTAGLRAGETVITDLDDRLIIQLQSKQHKLRTQLE